MGRGGWVCCLSCLRVTGGDGVKAGDERSSCFRVTAAGGGAEEEVADKVVGADVEHSCLRVIGGEGEEEEEDEEA